MASDVNPVDATKDLDKAHNNVTYPDGYASEITKSCTSEECITDEDQYKLECAICLRHVHYRCTQLPVFQIQLFLTKKYRKFMCGNCVQVPDYLKEILPKPEKQVAVDGESEIQKKLNLVIKENEAYRVNLLH